jgi:hypothetical protein
MLKFPSDHVCGAVMLHQTLVYLYFYRLLSSEKQWWFYLVKSITKLSSCCLNSQSKKRGLLELLPCSASVDVCVLSSVKLFNFSSYFSDCYSYFIYVLCFLIMLLLVNLFYRNVFVVYYSLSVNFSFHRSIIHYRLWRSLSTLPTFCIWR